MFASCVPPLRPWESSRMPGWMKACERLRRQNPRCTEQSGRPRPGSRIHPGTNTKYCRTLLAEEDVNCIMCDAAGVLPCFRSAVCVSLSWLSVCFLFCVECFSFSLVFSLYFSAVHGYATGLCCSQSSRTRVNIQSQE